MRRRAATRSFPGAPSFPNKTLAAVYRPAALFGLLALSIYLCVTAHPAIGADEIALGLVVIWLGFLPLLLFIRGFGSGPLPLMPAIGLFYAIAFGLPVFLDFGPLANMIDWIAGVSVAALSVVAGGLLSLYLGYYLSREAVWKDLKSFSLNRNSHAPNLMPILWVFIALDLLNSYTHWELAFPSMRYIVDASSSIAYGFLFYELFRGRLSYMQRLLLVWVALPLDIVARIDSGALAEPMMLGLLVVFVYWLARGRLPWVAIIAATLIVLELHDVKHKYRKLAWFDGELVNASAITKLKKFCSLALERSGSAEEGSGPVSNSLTLRAAQLGFLTRVVDQTPSVVPYWQGETYKILLYKMIPRLIWPEKPVETMGQDFSAKYNMRAFGDETTSFNVPWIVEMYANFGVAGVLCGMLLVGVLFGFIDKRFNGRSMGVLDRVFGLVLVFDLVYQESNFSLMVGNKVLIYLTLRFLFQSILTKEKRVTEARKNVWRGSPEFSEIKTAATGVAAMSVQTVVGRQ